MDKRLHRVKVIQEHLAASFHSDLTYLVPLQWRYFVIKIMCYCLFIKYMRVYHSETAKACSLFSYMIIGADSPFIQASSIITFATFFSEGSSYMVSKSAFSKIERNPRAPVFFSTQRSAITCNAASRNSNDAFSISKSLRYCFVKEFLGSVKILTKALLSNSSKVATTCKRPINSGIKPNLIKSAGSTSWSN